MLVALPSDAPGGLDARLGAHFGHCDMFTLVEVEDGKIGEAKIIPSIPHEHGGCMAPVNYLSQQGVKALIAGGMGMRPLMGFNHVGIDVYHNGGLATVKEALQAFADGKLLQFSQNMTCGGGQGHDGGCQH